ncbi:MAG: DMT family transporter [Rhodospirillaceae bacterium]|jgi:drug/metabolite transporter (DMT)-like permease|nr:DMT family transporter [Rhodospirillaceae bacterium]MBT5457222.1 DMT family transporter [Rhodospirillaceae bacterium]
MAATLPGTTRAALWMTICIVLFSAMTVLIRFLTDDSIPVHQIIFVRGVVSVALLVPWFARQGLQALVTRRMTLMLSRGALTSIGLVLWIYALSRIPLAEAVALHFTLPLFGVVLAIIILGERLNIHRWVGTAVGFSGTLVILRPGLEAVDLVSLVVLISALAYAGTGILTKILVRTESSAAIVFYVSAFTAVAFAIPCLFDWAAPTTLQWTMLVSIGVLNVLGQSCMNRSFAAADASFVMPFDFLRLPFAAAAGFFLFSEVPDFWTILGAVIIFGATYYVTWQERRSH